jgi:hypothetical protein
MPYGNRREVNDVDESMNERLACHARGDAASDWIALQYAYANLSKGGSGRWRPNNLFALVLLPEFKRCETEEYVAAIPEVSDRSGGAD